MKIMSNNNNNNNTNNNNKNTASGPSEALIRLSAPDGYYEYLGIPKPTNTNNNNGGGSANTSSEVDVEAIKKNYRKLSLKHHPDRPNGDADTFRLLNRAQRVLMNSRLRQEYDLLGLDLDDDTEEVSEEPATTGGSDSEKTPLSQSQESEGKEKPESNNNSNVGGGFLHEVASQALTFIMQLAIRTRKFWVEDFVNICFQQEIYGAFSLSCIVIY
jgi:hypothetical protein